MPWKETCVMDERMRLVVLVKDGTSIAEASRQFGVSRVTAHEWLKLYELEGMEALRNRSSAPHFHPHALSEEVSERIAALRCERPTWRPLKLVHWLWRESLIGMVDKTGHHPRAHAGATFPLSHSNWGIQARNAQGCGRVENSPGWSLGE